MFFKAKKREQEKLPLLMKENIRINCQPDSQEQVIRTAGQMLVDSGYVKPSYIEGMVQREKSFSTYMGNELALPHGVEEVKKEILGSGISVMIFPNGTQWGEEQVKIVIGIAGVGEEHLEILSIIADKMLSEEAAREIIGGDTDTIYRALTEGVEP